LKFQSIISPFKSILSPSIDFGNRGLRKFRGIHSGERAFIIGTGPSLSKVNLSPLKSEITFGVNGLCLYKGLDFDPTYYCISDRVAFEKYGSSTAKSKSTKFLSVPPCPPSSHWIQIPLDLNHQIKDGYFAGTGKNIIKTYWGRTVTMDLCIQLAFFMGFSRVYLLGCDCGISSTHFHHIYDNKQVASMNFSPYHNDIFESYRMCGKIFGSAGRELINSTVDGYLEELKRQNLADVLQEPRKSDSPSIKNGKVKTDVSESLPVGLAILLERINRIKARITIIN
jgi:hypothetical protein